MSIFFWVNDMKYIYDLGSIPQDKMNRVGGKARSLSHMLTDMKLNVPEGYVIICDAFKDGEILAEAASELDCLLPSLSSAFTYAVRSSAINEDGENASFAGQYETSLNTAKKDIPERVIDCYRSMFSRTVLL